jgi:hypothetical protein
MKSCKRTAAGIIFSALLALVPLGCSKSDTLSGIDPKSEGPHIATAGNLVGRYMQDNKGQVPKNTGELKDWAAKNNVPDDDLVSTRDHEPYEVHQVKQGPLEDLILTETTGVKGKKFMWRSTAMAPVGSEATQDQIDNAIKPSAGGRRRP